MYYLGKGTKKDEDMALTFYKKDTYTYDRSKARASDRGRHRETNVKKIVMQMRSKNFDALKTQHYSFISKNSLSTAGTSNSVPECEGKYYIYEFSNLIHYGELDHALFTKSENYLKMVWEIEPDNFKVSDFTDWDKPKYTTNDKKVTALDVLNDWKINKNHSTDNAPLEVRYKVTNWHEQKKDYVYHAEVKDATKIYVDFDKFQEGRYCSELKFKCLPESKDPIFLDETLYNGTASFDMSQKTKQRFKDLMVLQDINYDDYNNKTHPMCEKPPEIWVDNQASQDFIDNYSKKEELIEIEKSLAKELPGFWDDTPKVVRYNWILKSIEVADKEFDYGENSYMTKLTARIGVNFYLDPKWKFITGYVGSKERAIVTAADYIDYTIFNKTHDPYGNRFTSYLFSSELWNLPRIKNRTMPSLNDEFCWVWE
jgi:hypothetical protein